MVKAQCLIEHLSPTTDAMLPKEVGFVFYSEPPVIGPREDPCSASMAHDARISTWKPFSAIMAPAVREPMSMAIDQQGEDIQKRTSGTPRTPNLCIRRSSNSGRAAAVVEVIAMREVNNYYCCHWINTKEWIYSQSCRSKTVRLSFVEHKRWFWKVHFFPYNVVLF